MFLVIVCLYSSLDPTESVDRSVPSPLLASLIQSEGVVGWCDVLGKLPVPGRPTILITVGQGPSVLAVGAGGGCLDIFTLIYPFSPLSPSLWETALYRLKYCLKGPLNPKQPTNIYRATDGRSPCKGFKPFDALFLELLTRLVRVQDSSPNSAALTLG